MEWFHQHFAMVCTLFIKKKLTLQKKINISRLLELKFKHYPIIQSNDFPKAWPHIRLHNIYVTFN